MGGSLSAASGSISRGRGDAALEIGPESHPFDAALFEAKKLTDAEYGSLDQSTLVGVGAKAPTASGVGGESSGTARSAASAGGTGWNRRLQPRHRDAVTTFFGGSAAKPAPPAPPPAAGNQR